MKYIQRILVAILAVAWLSATAYAQSGSITGGSFSIINKRITLSGEFANLRSIQAMSSGEHLQLIDNGDLFPDFDTSPFSNGRVLANGAGEIVVAGSDSISDTSTTGILYNGAAADLETDLQLNVRVGLCDPIAVPIGSTIDFTCEKVPPPEIAPDSFFTVEAGRITLHGKMKLLNSVQVSSASNGLSLADGAEVILENKAPFPESAAVVTNTPDQVVIGVLGDANRITIEGPVATGILYSESLETAMGGDLTLNLGVADFGAGGDIDAYTLLDGVVTLTADRIERLAGIEAKSLGGHLSLAEIITPFPGKSTSPFSVLASNIVTESASEILIQSNRLKGRSIDGATPTGVIYSGTNFGDLVVTVGTTTGEVVTLSYVPEPATNAMFLMAGLGMLFTRSTRGR